jgi:hypothetical protein
MLKQYESQLLKTAAMNADRHPAETTTSAATKAADESLPEK